MSCRFTEEFDGDKLNEAARQAFYEVEGRWSLTLRDLGPRRIEALRVLRVHSGLPLSDVAKLAESGGTVVTGTLAEIEGPQTLLVEAGASVVSSREAKL